MINDNRIITFDGMRALAIILVVLHHVDIDKRIPFASDLFRYAALGCFIFVSGILLPVVVWEVQKGYDIFLARVNVG
jgi:peptidoglycan/LPS O-acetylase OafA/YrhL